jgi:hypothetical protein
MRFHTLEPAYSIILAFARGDDYAVGLRRVARIVGRSKDSVKRWAYPKRLNGTGGAIPRKHYLALQLASVAYGVKLTLEELATPGEEEKANGKKS